VVGEKLALVYDGKDGIGRRGVLSIPVAFELDDLRLKFVVFSGIICNLICKLHDVWTLGGADDDEALWIFQQFFIPIRFEVGIGS